MKRKSSLGQLQGELEPGRTPRLPLEPNGHEDLREPWGGLLASAGPRDHIVQLYQDQQFLNRAVCRFAASAIANGEGVILVPTAVEALGAPPPLHFIVRDQSGKSLVIEPLEGKLRIYENPVGVLTNSPTFDWHLTNLRNYIGLTAQNVSSIQLGGNFTLPQFGQGNGMFGLPGDSSPPARFVRAVAYSQTALLAATAADAVLQVFHIMNSFDIPLGSVRDKDGNAVHIDYTVWTSVADLKNLRWYFRTYTDQTIRQIDLRKALGAAGNQVRLISMSSEQRTKPSRIPSSSRSLS